MGQATIVSGGSGGQYVIRVDHGTARRDARVAALTTVLVVLEQQIVQAQAALDTAEAEKAVAQSEAAAAIEAYATAAQTQPGADLKALMKAMQEAVDEVVRAEGRVAPHRQQLTMLQADKTSKTRQKAALQALALQQQLTAWCADLTEDATGAVATIEVPGEPLAVLVAPGGRAPAAGDGQVLARELMSPEQVYLNAAILPGWQKFKPTYRTGVIVSVDQSADTATVTLDATWSSAQNLDVNQATTLVNVPVEYMTCNAAVFEPGDRCVVRFDGQDWASPRVIGFAEWPKACEVPPYVRVSVVRCEDPFDPPLASAPLRPLFYGLASCPGGGYLEYMQGFSPITRRRKRVYWTSTWAGSSNADGWIYEGIASEKTLFEEWDERAYNDSGFQSININSGNIEPSTVEPIDFLRIQRSFYPYETMTALALGGTCDSGVPVTKQIWADTEIDFVHQERLQPTVVELFNSNTDDVFAFLGAIPETVNVIGPSGKTYVMQSTGWQLSSGGWFALYTPDGMLP